MRLVYCAADSGTLRACARVVTVAAALLASVGAWAEVTLSTAVSKVQSTLDAEGQVQRELVAADEVVPGDELRYTITFANDSDITVDAGRIVITNAIPAGTLYVPGSAGGNDSQVAYSSDGETFTADEPAAPAGAEGAAGQHPASGAAAGGGAPAAAAAVQSLRWTYQQPLAPGQSGQVYFHVRMQ